MKIKEYIRSTHIFDNDTREWIGRDEQGQDKWKEWNTREVAQMCSSPIFPTKWSFGVHALHRDRCYQRVFEIY